MSDLNQLLEQGQQELDREEYELARDKFEQAVNLAPNDDRVLYLLGLAYYRFQNYQKAIALLNQSLQINPSNINALSRRDLTYQAILTIAIPN